MLRIDLKSGQNFGPSETSNFLSKNLERPKGLCCCKKKYVYTRMRSVLSMVCVWDAYGIETPKSELLLTGHYVKFNENSLRITSCSTDNVFQDFTRFMFFDNYIEHLKSSTKTSTKKTWENFLLFQSISENLFDKVNDIKIRFDSRDKLMGCDIIHKLGGNELHKPKLLLDTGKGYQQNQNGIEGSILLEYKANDKLKKVNLPIFGAEVIRKLCRVLYYANGVRKNSKNYSQQEQIFSPKNRKCKNIFAKIVETQDLSEDELSFIENCIESNDKAHLVVSCKNPVTTNTNLALHNSDGINFCPIGFSRRSGEKAEDYPKNNFCLPNRCTCDNGMAAVSSFDFMDRFCGVTLENEVVDEDASDRSTRLNTGEETTKTKWPFQVMLFKDITSEEPHCNSAILSPTFLLTAGHCLRVD